MLAFVKVFVKKKKKVTIKGEYFVFFEGKIWSIKKLNTNNRRLTYFKQRNLSVIII